jgi:hypothetical protein
MSGLRRFSVAMRTAEHFGEVPERSGEILEPRDLLAWSRCRLDVGTLASFDFLSTDGSQSVKQWP